MMGSNIIFNMGPQRHHRRARGLRRGYQRWSTVKAERPHADINALNIGDRGRVKSIKVGCEYGDNKFLDCFIINRDLLLDIIDNYQSADYLDLFEAIAGDFERIDRVQLRVQGTRPWASSTRRPTTGASMEQLDPATNDQLFVKDRPIRTKAHDAPPAKYSRGSNATNSLISAGCEIMGTVRGSILSRGVKVESGASVTNSIIMQSCTIKSGGPRRERHHRQEQHRPREHRAARHPRCGPGRRAKAAMN